MKTKVKTKDEFEPTSGQWSLVYRPKKIEKVIVGNTEILGEIREAVKGTQAWLITGDTGTGKTTLARVIGRMINGNDDSVIEKSSTKNGIDDIRELEKALKYQPKGKKWIAILDEVHLLTTQAAKALLKLTEDPPHPNVVFILCTNHEQSVIKELKGRCQTFNIKKPTFKQAYPSLAEIMRVNGVKVKEEVMDKLVRKALADADFCFRQTLQYLQSYRNKLISGANIKTVLSGVSEVEGEDSNVGNVEQIAGGFLRALMMASDNKAASYNHFFAETSKCDVVAVMTRMLGVVYHGYSLKVGGKWNWQSGPYKDIFSGIKPPSVVATLLIIRALTLALADLKNITDETMRAASATQYLCALANKLAK